jgi:hypothetical protein
MILTTSSIKAAASEAAYARDNLTYIDKYGKRKSKVCCLCDSLILYPNERRLYLVEDLQHNDVGLLFLEKNVKWPYDNLSNRTKTKILKYYKQGCYNMNDHK